jgi:hypothetical protein
VPGRRDHRHHRRQPGPRPGITARSGHWSAPGPPWPWLAPSNFS